MKDVLDALADQAGVGFLLGFGLLLPLKLEVSLSMFLLLLLLHLGKSALSFFLLPTLK